jgi:hypothetical protein
MTAPTHADIWEKMSGIDVSEFVQSRSVGNRTLSWIPWSDCLALLQAHYPSFEYEFFPVMLYPDGSAEVECKVTIGDVSRQIHLPVMDHKFNAIVAGPGSSPDSRSINDAKMRAFVKAVSILTGLGFQLYRDGSGVPVPVNPSRSERAADLESKVMALEALLRACEQDGNVNEKGLALARQLIKDGGPVERVASAILYLTAELNDA